MSAITLSIPDIMERPKYVNNERVGVRKVAMKRFQKIRAEWRVESLPSRFVVWEGAARGKVTIDLDPGKYVWIAHFNDRSKINNFKYHEEFLHEVSEEQWAELHAMVPRITKTCHTTMGVMYRCQFVGCDEEQTSRMAAVLHEAEHQGVDLLANPDQKAEVDNALEEYAQEKAGRKRGANRAVGKLSGPGRKMDN